MYYFDNAATSHPKPASVGEAVKEAIDSFASPGRGVYKDSLLAGQVVFETREKLAKMFGAKSVSNVIFAPNATFALNYAINSLAVPGTRIVTTAASHNSVLRPMAKMEDEKGCKRIVVPIGRDGSLDYEDLREALSNDASLCVVTHSSNVTGDIYDIERIRKIALEYDVPLVIDAAQTAGLIPLKLDNGISAIAFTGHKSLYGPQGTGGLAINDGVAIAPMIEGGSGIQSFERRQPNVMPEAFEAGTINSHSIAGLSAGIDYVNEVGMDVLAEKIFSLTRRFDEQISQNETIKIYGKANGVPTAITSLNIGDVDSAQVSEILSTDFDIATRSGAHCAPLMHRALGTERQGTVRFSFGSFNTEEEIDYAANAVLSLANEIV
ncbi:MAG: aminotransferase class V-fold PLP-dependent enzyme [Eggerthellaceae bacterium]|nr:aminotransferase class V-fold PLP-dependent enzyme [Eggerthellaceae bacterium]